MIPYLSVTPYKDILDVYDMFNPDTGIFEGKGKVELQHNVYNFAAMQAQSDLCSYQGIDDLYFTGGWAVGSGLQEEILAQSKNEVAAPICGVPVDNNWENYLRDYPKHVPDHIRRALS